MKRLIFVLVVVGGLVLLAQAVHAVLSMGGG